MLAKKVIFIWLKHFLRTVDFMGIYLYVQVAFQISCENGNKEIVELFLKYSRVDVNIRYEMAFRYVCGNGYTEIVKILYNIEDDRYIVAG